MCVDNLDMRISIDRNFCEIASGIPSKVRGAPSKQNSIGEGRRIPGIILFNSVISKLLKGLI